MYPDMDTHSRRWSERWSWQFILTVLSMLALMLLISVVSEAIAGHAIATEGQIAWQTQLDRVEEGVNCNDLDGAPRGGSIP
jgi:hypothetical protein